MTRMKQWGRSAAVRLSLLMALCLPFAVVAFAQSDAADFDPKGLWDGRKLVPFKALDDPKMVKASEADFLTDDDYILGVTVNGESRAYPTRFAWFHHIINDKAGKPEARYAVTYCSVCNTGIRFDPVIDGKADGKPVMIDFYGLYNGVACFADRETQSVLLQVSGQFVTGPLKGKSLKFGPLLDTTWKEWKTRHPDTLVMSPDTEFARFYSPKDKPEKRGYDKFPMPAFGQSMTRQDKRLPRFEKVLAVALPVANASPITRAFPVAALRDAGGVVNDKVGNAPVTVFLDAKTTTAAAYSPVIEGKTLTFELRAADGKSAYYDRETGTRWNMDGVAEDGKYKGKTLSSIPNHLSQWYGWVAYFPQTTIYGNADAPKTEAWTEGQ